MKINAKVYRALLRTLSVLVLLVIAGVVAFVVVQISGRNKLYSHSGGDRPNLGNSELIEVLEPLEETTEESPDENAYVSVPDVMGLSVMEANRLMESSGLSMRANGTGIAVFIEPEAGSRVFPGETIQVEFSVPDG